jgi:hypothetical protein
MNHFLISVYQITSPVNEIVRVYCLRLRSHHVIVSLSYTVQITSTYLSSFRATTINLLGRKQTPYEKKSWAIISCCWSLTNTHDKAHAAHPSKVPFRSDGRKSRVGRKLAGCDPPPAAQDPAATIPASIQSYQNPHPEKKKQHATAAIKTSASTGVSPNSISNSRVLLLPDPVLRSPPHRRIRRGPPRVRPRWWVPRTDPISAVFDPRIWGLRVSDPRCFVVFFRRRCRIRGPWSTPASSLSSSAMAERVSFRVAPCLDWLLGTVEAANVSTRSDGLNFGRCVDHRGCLPLVSSRAPWLEY